jgi:hypothetical protein
VISNRTGALILIEGVKNTRREVELCFDNLKILLDSRIYQSLFCSGGIKTTISKTERVRKR